jgi:hypothetical protein
MVLCVVFLGAGGMKLLAYRNYMETVGRGLELSRGMVTFIGICEIAGGLGVILPGFSGIAPILAPFAAVGLGIVMLLATGFQIKRGESPWVPLVLLIMAGFVAVGRGFG